MPVFNNEKYNLSIWKGPIPKFPIQAKIWYCKYKQEKDKKVTSRFFYQGEKSLEWIDFF